VENWKLTLVRGVNWYNFLNNTLAIHIKILKATHPITRTFLLQKAMLCDILNTRTKRCVQDDYTIFVHNSKTNKQPPDNLI